MAVVSGDGGFEDLTETPACITGWWCLPGSFTSPVSGLGPARTGTRSSSATSTPYAVTRLASPEPYASR